MVPLWSKRPGDGDEMLTIYAAALLDPNDAVEAVKRAANFSVDGDRIHPATPMLDDTFMGLGLSPGEVQML